MRRIGDQVVDVECPPGYENLGHAKPSHGDDRALMLQVRQPVALRLLRLNSGDKLVGHKVRPQMQALREGNARSRWLSSPASPRPRLPAFSRAQMRNVRYMVPRVPCIGQRRDLDRHRTHLGMFESALPLVIEQRLQKHYPARVQALDQFQRPLHRPPRNRAASPRPFRRTA